MYNTADTPGGPERGSWKMHRKEEWELEDYVTENGERPIRTFLSGLEEQDRVNAAALIRLLKERGNSLKFPHSKPLGGGLFELRNSWFAQIKNWF
jgi:hypothetical protein